jgi:predicted ester cyclase
MKTMTALALTLGCATTALAQATSADSSKALVSKFWSEVWNPPYSMATLDELVAEDFIITTDGKDIQGKNSFKSWLQGFQAKVDDLKVVPQEILVTDDGKRVITRMHATGKNKGLFGTQPNGAPVEFTAISIMEVKDGKLAHNWVERSAYELSQRLNSAGK